MCVQSWDNGAIAMPGATCFPDRSFDPATLLTDRAELKRTATQGATIAHEVTHIRQYLDRFNSPIIFGWEYMFQYCKAGYSYSGNSFERAANDTRAMLDPLVKGNGALNVYARWLQHRNTLGYPTSPKP